MKASKTKNWFKTDSQQLVSKKPVLTFLIWGHAGKYYWTARLSYRCEWVCLLCCVIHSIMKGNHQQWSYTSPSTPNSFMLSLIIIIWCHAIKTSIS